ncbi:MAG: oxygenase MpaB family protein, partial [Mycobacteriales bacterium]
ADYWEESLKEVRIDDDVRDYLLALIRYENVPRWIGRLLAKRSEFLTTGFLPPLFREQLGLPWDEQREARFQRYLTRLARLLRVLPRPIRVFPFNWLLHDLRRRDRKGIPLV